MPETRQLIRIYVAAPQDVQEERNRLHDVVADLNAPGGAADQHKCILQVLDWHDVWAHIGPRPEQVILDQLPVESWDIFVGTLWMRFGTPSGGQDPATGKYYDSGTEEEFQLAFDAWKETKRPQIFFYRRTSGPTSLRELDVEQYAKVEAFCKQFDASGEHPGLLQGYETPTDFERRVRNDLQRLLTHLTSHVSTTEAPPVDLPKTTSAEPILNEAGDDLVTTDIEWIEYDEMAIREFFSYYSEEPIDVTNRVQLLSKLRGWGLVTPVAGRWVFTKVGALMFGPKEGLTRYVHTDVWLDDKRIGGIKSFNGYPVMRLLSELLDILRPLWEESWEDTSTRDENGRPQKFALYPREAIVEALVNWIIHRDYKENDLAWMNLYANKIEMINPGLSRYPPVILLEGTDVRPKYRRNTHLIEITSRTRLNQRQGHGFAAILETLKANGNIFADGRPAVEAENIEEDKRFKLVIYARERHLEDHSTSGELLRRRDHLNELANTILDLTTEYQTKEQLTSDPRERLSGRQNIEVLKRRLVQVLAELQDLEKQIQSGRVAPDIPPLAAPSGPFQVPPLPVQGVFGREEELVEIPSLLKLDDPNETNVQPLALIGMGGVGKTTLARAIGRQEGIRERFPDGVLWAELGPEPNVRLLLNDWGRSLGIDLLPQPDVTAASTRLRDVLYNKRVFLIVDDIWDPNTAGHFLVGGPYSRILLTTREPWIAYALATRPRTMRVNVLSLESSLAVLRSLVPEVVSAEDAMAAQLCERLEYLPLALNLAGRLLATESDNLIHMRDVLDELIERREARLGLLQVEGRKGSDQDNPVSLQAILGMSVERLNTLDQDRFAMLSVFGGEPLTWEINAAASVWECSVEQARNTISHFINRGLIEARPNSRYWIHALLADYAEAMLEERGL